MPGRKAGWRFPAASTASTGSFVSAARVRIRGLGSAARGDEGHPAFATGCWTFGDHVRMHGADVFLRNPRLRDARWRWLGRWAVKVNGGGRGEDCHHEQDCDLKSVQGISVQYIEFGIWIRGLVEWR